jgi:hypothetical protein
MSLFDAIDCIAEILDLVGVSSAVAWPGPRARDAR